MWSVGSRTCVDNGATTTGKTSRSSLIPIKDRNQAENRCEIWMFFVRFKKFNDRVLRRILVRDNRAESSIVALYKKLELQNAMELLDTPMGDLSAAPSIVSLTYVQSAVGMQGSQPSSLLILTFLLLSPQ